MTDRDLPRLLERPHSSRLLTRDEVADRLGYSRTSMATVMSRDPQRWPRPAAMLRRGRVWVLLWDADEIDAVAPPATATQRRGARATVSDSDGLLTCLECGRRYRSLGRHLHAAHQLSAAEYRARHDLPATAALRADGDRERSAQYWRQRLAVDPTAVDHLQPWNRPDHLDAIRPKAIEVHRSTRELEIVRAHRAPGQRYAVQAMLARRRARLDDLARAAGYPDFAAAIEAMRDLPATEAARRIGCGASTVRRYRARRPG